MYREVRQSLIDMKSMFDLMNVPSSIVSRPQAVNLVCTKQLAEIEFRNVAFQYPFALSSERRKTKAKTDAANASESATDKQKEQIAITKRPVLLHDVSFTVKTGQKVAIVGGSGCGKSTIVRLLYRFYDTQSGQVLINGVDVRDVTLDSLRRSIAVVPQETVLFHNTIAYNLHYGDLSKPLTNVIDVSRMVDLHDAVERMPNGYETRVGERGMKLSGGERQRIAIGRALLKDAPICVFDEATSSLDSLTEAHILKALRRTALGRTSIVIAHRLSTIVDADQILVMANGTICERGTHAQLVADRHSVYHRMWMQQTASTTMPSAA